MVSRCNDSQVACLLPFFLFLGPMQAEGEWTQRQTLKHNQWTVDAVFRERVL